MMLFRATFTGQIMKKFSTAALLLAFASATNAFAATDEEVKISPR